MLNLRAFLFIFSTLFFLNLNATSIKDQLITSVAYSIDGKNFVNINELKTFEEELKILQKDHISKFTIRININKSILNKNVYYIQLYKKFIWANVPYILKDNLPLIKIDKKTTDSINILYSINGNSALFLNMQIYNQFEYKYILNIEKILFGISYGIIICAFLYNFVFFLYNREKAFLYYSILQILLLLFLLAFTATVEIYNNFNVKEIVFYISILIPLSLIISILFNIEFLNTKNFTPKIHKFLWILVYLNLIDILSLIIDGESFILNYIPSYCFIFVLLFSAFIILKKGYKPAIFYIIGWLCLFIFIFFSETDFVELNGSYLLHIGIPLESLLFSFALGFKVKQVEIEKQRNETILINQSKLASMGEMIGNIAHQWRQPLTHLSYIIMNLKAAYENEKLDKNYLQKKTNEANRQIEFMSHTIDDFRNFFKPSKQKETFVLTQCIDETINLLKENLKVLGIYIEFTSNSKLKISTYKGELAQVIFNILNNSKDEFIRKNISKPKILITLTKKNKNIVIEISDNAGGIKNEIIKKVFEPYFTTKEEGLGIGLYISKMIIERNIEGKLEVENISNGVKFSIYLPFKSIDSKIT